MFRLSSRLPTPGLTSGTCWSAASGCSPTPSTSRSALIGQPSQYSPLIGQISQYSPLNGWLPQPEIVFWNLEATLALFQPVLTRGVLPVFEDINRDKKHTNIFLVVTNYFYISISQQGLPPRLCGYRDGGSRPARQPRA